METEQVNTVDEATNVNLGMVKEPVLRRYAKTLGLKASKLDVPGLVLMVTTKTAEDRKVKLDVEYVECECGGITPSDLVTCPFCGEGEETPLEVGSERSESPAPTAIVKVDGAPHGPYGKTNGLAITKPDEDLRRALKHAKKLVVDWHSSAWEIGEQLLVLTAESPEHPALWKLQKGEDGTTQRYKGFADFLLSELGLKPDAARTFMYLAKECTRDEVEGWTISKVGLILNAPEQHRRHLLQTASALPASEVRARVQELKLGDDAERKKNGLPGAKDKTGASREKRLSARQKRASQEHAAKDAAKGVFTFVMSGQTATVKLFRKTPDATENFSQATSVTDAWGWLEGKNGTKLVFRLEKDAKGHLKIRFEGKREASE